MEGQFFGPVKSVSVSTEVLFVILVTSSSNQIYTFELKSNFSWLSKSRVASQFLFRFHLCSPVFHVLHMTLMCQRTQMRSSVTANFAIRLSWHLPCSWCFNTSSGSRCTSIFASFPECRPTESSYRCRTVLVSAVIQPSMDGRIVEITRVVAVLLAFVVLERKQIPVRRCREEADYERWLVEVLACMHKQGDFFCW